MEWLNYHHLLYFWMVAREGSITRASKILHLSQPTVSSQLQALERSLKAKLFEKTGRSLTLTETGRLVYRYASDIFSLGKELQDAVKGRPTGRPVRLLVGVSDALPKLVVQRLIEPALRMPETVRIVCQDGRSDELLTLLATHELDVVLNDGPASPLVKVRAFNHLLGECDVTFFGTKPLVKQYRTGFPESLDGAPILLPMEGATLRHNLDQWFDQIGVRPELRGEFADSALLKVFGQAGLGIFAAPTVVAQQVRDQYGVEPIGQAVGVRERFFAITIEKRIKNPAVVAISESAKKELFA